MRKNAAKIYGGYFSSHSLHEHNKNNKYFKIIDNKGLKRIENLNIKEKRFTIHYGTLEIVAVRKVCANYYSQSRR